ncbi:MAG: hypothetical protein GY847_10790 [Proteobacteria bacterium]|nr:hypothetical protein [Pseudomonadota bacterium]
MSQSSNTFVDVAIGLQKQWSEALSNISNVVSGEKLDLNGLDTAPISKAWSEGIRQIVDNGLPKSVAATMKLPDFLEHVNQTTSNYTSLFDQWSQIPHMGDNKGDKSDRSTPNPVDWFKGFTNSMQSWLPAYEGLPGATGANAWQQAMTAMAGNWTRLVNDLGDRVNTNGANEKPETDQARHFYESWLKAYESTMGPFVNMTTIGPARYEVEKLNKGADTYMKYQAASADFYGKMYQTGMEALQEVMSESNNIFSDDVTDEGFNKFYHLLMTVGERRYHELFSSPLFCQSLESFINTGLDWYQARNDMTEEMLKSTPIVTQSQADEIYREMHSLKKRLMELERTQRNQGAHDQGDTDGSH